MAGYAVHEKGGAAADALPSRREVSGVDVWYEDAVASGVVDIPPPMSWQLWRTYRKVTRTRPTEEEDGPDYRYDASETQREEMSLYTRVMKHYYGENFNQLAGMPSFIRTGWRNLKKKGPLRRPQ